jgi:hypothetical protein
MTWWAITLIIIGVWIGICGLILFAWHDHVSIQQEADRARLFDGQHTTAPDRWTDADERALLRELEED